MSMHAASKQRLRGQPVKVLLLLALVWTGFRFVTWTTPFDMGGAAVATFSSAVGQQAAAQSQQERAQEPLRLQSPVVAPSYSDPSGWRAPMLQGVPVSPSWSDPGASVQGQEISQLSAGSLRTAPRMASGHAMLMAAGFSQMELPPQLAAHMRAAIGSSKAQEGAAASGNAPFPFLAAQGVQERSRWSADGWLLWRQGSDSPLVSGNPSYGRSQAGAVLRYELAPSSRHRPQAYLRATTALEGTRERDLALGMSARPLASIPVRLHAEARVSERAGGKEVRPAAFAVTELPSLALPGGLRGEAYAQAGYVGGDFATGFVDGQARVDRTIAADEDFDLRAGAGVWGGAQDGAGRLDVGPSASLTFRLGETRGRVAADYRFRVAGDARPASGPALTLSAGF